MEIDLRLESKEFREWVEQKTAAAIAGSTAQGLPASVGAVVVLYNYDQGGWIALDFNTDEEFEYGGDVSKAAWDDLFLRPAWTPFAEAKGPATMTLVEVDGTLHSVSPEDVTDEFFSSHLGKMIAEVVTAAWSENVFSALPLRPGFLFIVDDFNGGWGWGAKEVSGKLENLAQY